MTLEYFSPDLSPEGMRYKELLGHIDRLQQLYDLTGHNFRSHTIGPDDESEFANRVHGLTQKIKEYAITTLPMGKIGQQVLDFSIPYQDKRENQEVVYFFNPRKQLEHMVLPTLSALIPVATTNILVEPNVGEETSFFISDNLPVPEQKIQQELGLFEVGMARSISGNLTSERKILRIHRHNEQLMIDDNEQSVGGIEIFKEGDNYYCSVKQSDNISINGVAFQEKPVLLIPGDIIMVGDIGCQVKRSTTQNDFVLLYRGKSDSLKQEIEEHRRQSAIARVLMITSQFNSLNDEERAYLLGVLNDTIGLLSSEIKNKRRDLEDLFNITNEDIQTTFATGKIGSARNEFNKMMKNGNQEKKYLMKFGEFRETHPVTDSLLRGHQKNRRIVFLLERRFSQDPIIQEVFTINFETNYLDSSRMRFEVNLDFTLK